ncbi:MAG: chromosome segregation protein SMC [Cyanobacteria bacterium QS_8_64_29]|nr:MAG: chromosome segregation protein SMC [Cyanobacteria bacterium QS_8_64_29]
MVHIKRLELSNFKSFGKATQIPLRPGFTVVSGPNGSGKSNILDALLFALGLSGSKGMRAERLPDLVSHSKRNGRARVDTRVTVTFDISDWSDPQEIPESGEWQVTRRLRLNEQGQYSSSYYVNDEPLTRSELHERLYRMRIYPQGYNVVLQGDVTRIITMNARERREIVDELAGVADYDRKIAQARETLEDVREREERCRVVETELIQTRDRAAAERDKAERYRELKSHIQQLQQWEAVLAWRSLQQDEAQLQAQIEAHQRERAQLDERLEALSSEIEQARAQLEDCNARVRDLGEDQQLALTSQLATQQTQQQQLQQRQQELAESAREAETELVQAQQALAQHQQALERVQQEQARLENERLVALEAQRDRAQQALEQQRSEADRLAAAAETWLQQHTDLSQRIAKLQQALEPQRNESAQLQERQRQLQAQLDEQTQAREAIQPDWEAAQQEHARLERQAHQWQQQQQALAERLAAARQESETQQQTRDRLRQEWHDKQRQLDRLEATQHARQEAQGTRATQTLLQSALEGICGLVAQLGQVAPSYQLALETAAGGRLGHVVVEDDSVAAAGIELLRQQKAGRATFLPLNKLRPPRSRADAELKQARGFLDYAVNLIEHPPRYRNVFAYVLGDTAVFETLDDARRHLGRNRIVTLQGELLERSGAISGGSQAQRPLLRLGTDASSDTGESEALKQRLQDIEAVLDECERTLQAHSEEIERLERDRSQAQQQQQACQWQCQQLQQQIQRLSQQRDELDATLSERQRELASVTEQLQALEQSLPEREAELERAQQQLAQLERSHTHQRWQQIQREIAQQQDQLQACERDLQSEREARQEAADRQQRLRDQIQACQQRQQASQQRQQQLQRQRDELAEELSTLEAQIEQTQRELTQLSQQLDGAKQARDRADANLQSLQQRQQQAQWRQQQLDQTLQSQQETLQATQQKRQAREAELPDLLPEGPLPLTPANGSTDSETPAAQLERLQPELRDAQKRLQAMEPVNMLAIEEYERAQQRLQDLSDKRQTLEAERTELLSRIENFTTQRLQAFHEAFDAVNRNFRAIFAQLSDGDGYLQLDDPDEPANGGLNLVAHPQGKPVQRLHAMSGGEKSLTALSFIFALQHYRPSPFYAFDEVDMFLDGANVERLAKMIRQQAQQAQFIVVSLRRPTISAADRTLGVTQARGAHTQVLGITVPASSH